MTNLYIASGELEKWLFQNKAECTGDFIEGVLLDNFVVSTKRGFAAIFERSLNCWSSDYEIVFQPGEAQDVFAEWHRFAESCGVEVDA